MGISLSGLASGIDWQSILEQLREAEQTRLELLNNQKTALEDRLTAWRDLASKLTSLKTAVDDLRDSWDLALYSATLTTSDSSINPDSILSVTTSTDATPGVYQVQVLQIATPQKEYSEAFTSADQDTGKTGTITINGTNITLDGKSLEQIRDEINQLDLGVTASILKVSDNEYRLLITSDNTGSAGFTFDASASDMTFTEQAGTDAQISIDGITITRSSNAISDALTGVTFDILSEAPSTTLTLRIDHDIESIQLKVETFVNAYNDVLDEIAKHLTGSTNADDEAGPLASDFTIQTVKANLQNVYLSAELYEIGITINDNNRLEFDSSEFQNAINSDFESVADKLNSFATSMYQQLNRLTDPVDGTITLKENSLEDRIEGIEERISREQERIDRYIEMLTEQFIRMEEALFDMQSQSTWLSQLFSSSGTSSSGS
ncbi:flagellar filament capping protein FliD [Thermodesulforhabdus norvegica]|uniref:Flagellar hook-associated protein 2 n=1 Tax=Thermodesulforhabdus norvegica TaxID=39841 RepID=A0A1I4QSQ7_9BACT|nr:flagellar filament capping protein FliD [Thermodesulforhabdus norvegica]SFM43094.1 flagellar hook-associated protein 2 [Thermodesulforhabdus norvegica]